MRVRSLGHSGWGVENESLPGQPTLTWKCVRISHHLWYRALGQANCCWHRRRQAGKKETWGKGGEPGPSCLSNAVLEGPGLWSQPSPCLPAKGCFPPVPSPVHHPIASDGRGLSQPCPPMPGPAWRAPQHLGHATRWQSHPLGHSVSHLFTGQLLCDRHCAAAASSGSRGVWIIWL